MRTFIEKLQRFIAEKVTPGSNGGNGRARLVVIGTFAAVALVAVVAVVAVALRPGDTQQVTSGELSAEVTSAASGTDKQAPGTAPEDTAEEVQTETVEEVINKPSGAAGLGGAVPKTATPPPEPEPEPEPEPVPAPIDEAAPAQEPTPTPAGGPSAEAWAKLRDCEASGRYDAVNTAGYYGAYQFNQGTWDSIASSSGRNDLVGINPAQAAPGDQDAMAFALYASRGAQPWPTCGRFL